MTNNLNCLHCFVRGRVQGVGFRNWVQKKAKIYAFTGWVKNCENGELEIKVTGNINKLKDFLSDLKKGPFLAKVESINHDFIKDYVNSKFMILR